MNKTGVSSRSFSQRTTNLTTYLLAERYVSKGLKPSFINSTEPIHYFSTNMTPNSVSGARNPEGDAILLFAPTPVPIPFQSKRETGKTLEEHWKNKATISSRTRG